MLFLDDLLADGAAPAASGGIEGSGDRHLQAGEFAYALAAYTQGAAEGRRTAEKLGYVAFKLDRPAEAARALAPYLSEIGDVAAKAFTDAFFSLWMTDDESERDVARELVPVLELALQADEPRWLWFYLMMSCRHLSKVVPHDRRLRYARKAARRWDIEETHEWVHSLNTLDCDQETRVRYLCDHLKPDYSSRYHWLMAEAFEELGYPASAAGSLARCIELLPREEPLLPRLDTEELSFDLALLDLKRLSLHHAAGNLGCAADIERMLEEGSLRGPVMARAVSVYLGIVRASGDDAQIRRAGELCLRAGGGSGDMLSVFWEDWLEHESDYVWFWMQRGRDVVTIFDEDSDPDLIRWLACHSDTPAWRVLLALTESWVARTSWLSATVTAQDLVTAEVAVREAIPLAGDVPTQGVVRHLVGSLVWLHVHGSGTAQTDWRGMGRDWMGACMALPVDREAPPWWRSLDLDTFGYGKVALKALFTGMADALDALTHSQDADALFADELRDHLLDPALRPLFRRLALRIHAEYRTATTEFDAGLGEDWAGARKAANEHYLASLEKGTPFFSPIFNLLLNCSKPADAGVLAKVTPFAEGYAGDEEEMAKIGLELARARIDCADPGVLARQIITQELQRYAPLIDTTPAAGRVSLRDLVAMLALHRAAGASVGDLVLEPFGITGTVFSPVLNGERVLFRLLGAGWVGVDGRTSLEAFGVEKERVSAYRFAKVRWQVAPAAVMMLHKAMDRAKRRPWLKGWLQDLLPLATELAIAECETYIDHAATERRWPTEVDRSLVRSLCRDLVEQVSVSESFYLIYLGAMAASDQRARLPINDAQASHNMVIAIRRKLDRYLAEPWPLKRFDRPHALPRSAMSLALFEDILCLGDAGFHQRLDTIAFPR